MLLCNNHLGRHFLSLMSYYSKHIYFGGHWCPEEKLNETINLYSDHQRYTVLRNDAILSLSLLP